MRMICIFALFMFAAGAHAIITSSTQPGLVFPPPVPAGGMEACNDKNEDDLCTIVTPTNDTIEGSCHRRPPETGVMVCIPNYPQDLIDACKDKKEGDGCNFTSKTNTEMGGSCRRGSFHGAPVVCAVGVPPDPQ